MGEANLIHSSIRFDFSFLSSLDTSNWIDIVGIVVNSAFAIWIVLIIQNKFTNKRVLKDYFINEIKELRQDYRLCLQNLYTNNTNPRIVIPWFKLMNIKVENIMEIISKKYNIDIEKLKPYQRDFQELITNNQDFIDHFRSDKIIFSEYSKNQILIFQQEYNHLFNELIMEINDA